MYNDPLLLSAMLADRRADLQRAATRSHNTPSTRRRTWFRRLDIAALRRRRPEPTSVRHDPLEDTRDPLEREVTTPVAVDRDSDPVLVGASRDDDQDARDAEPALV